MSFLFFKVDFVNSNLYFVPFDVPLFYGSHQKFLLRNLVITLYESQTISAPPSVNLARDPLQYFHAVDFSRFRKEFAID